ncbi:MAG TPA: nickel pincer cofactor biosynthesis protein LarC [Syntrophorhabdaceae bacterium]|nr:nickel pincer cofactor biosynthesis protein LarC [Syntrophorhabdaceae bacterium]HPU29652.1 nickel pincer cofactor biosynthesis protein LarC [Syntrophorhabdaceae bacterium]
MKIMFIDPVFGLSGDMMIAALIHGGYPFESFLTTIKKIPLPLPDIEPELLSQGVIEGIHLKIKNVDIHLTIEEMEKIIQGIDVDGNVKRDAWGMLRILIDAESKIHNILPDEIHFHELSNIDTLIDLIGVAHGMNYLGIEKVFCGPVPCGNGTIKTSHGIIPNPPPVTLEILNPFKIVFLDEPLELTTPTGATIIRYYAQKYHPAPPMKVERIGYGVGTYKSMRPDILRIFIGTLEDKEGFDEVWIIETDIDDMDLEYLAPAVERIRDAGALECVFFPVYMKKGRLGVRLSILVKDDKLEKVKNTVFSETTTFGIRIRKDSREVLKREIKKEQTPFGTIHVKYGYNSQGEPLKTHIEFDDVKKIADQTGISYLTLFDEIKKSIK